MSSGCFLMQILPRIHLILFVAILTNRGMAQPYLEKNDKGLPGDFLKFIKTIDSLIYKHVDSRHKIIDSHKGQNPKEPDSSHASKLIQNHDNKIQSTEKVGLKDVLMMKLVSYYEDKYKVSSDFQNTDLEKMMPLTTSKTDSENELFVSEATTSYNDIEDIPEVVIL